MKYLFNKIKNRLKKINFFRNNAVENIYEDTSEEDIFDNDILYEELPLYYLLYKIKDSDKLWIVKINYDLNNLIIEHKKIKTRIDEDYFVIKKLHSYNPIFKQFEVFIKTKDCQLIYSTQK